MINLRPLSEEDLTTVWKIGYSHSRPAWKEWDAPYFDDYQAYPDALSFSQSKTANFLLSDKVRGIFLNEEIIGFVSRYWIDERTRWLEIGIVIFQAKVWQKGYGFHALHEWIPQTFKDIPILEHIGLTTWSGNQGMMKTTEKLGMVQEARIRKVRFWNENYDDSIKYGILREEWSNHD